MTTVPLKEGSVSLLMKETEGKVNFLKKIADHLAGVRCVPEARLHVCKSEGGEDVIAEKGKSDRGLVIPRETPMGDVLSSSIAQAGASLRAVVDELVAAIEEQILLIFQQVANKQKELEADASVVRKHRWEDTEGLSMSPLSLSLSPEDIPPTQKQNQKSKKDPPPNPLGPYLHCFLEGLVHSVEAEKGYVYLTHESANGSFLRCVAQVPASNESNDIPLTSTCIPCTVLLTGVGANTSYDIASAQRSSKSRNLVALPIPGAVRQVTDSTVPLSNLCRGRTSCGVVVVQNKRNGSVFRPRDETVIAHAAILLSANMMRYPMQLFLQKYDSSALRKLATTQFRQRGSTQLDDLLHNAKHSEAGEQLILRLPKENITTRDVNTGIKATVSYDAELKECMTYIHNLELMWRNCLNEKSVLQSDLQKAQKELSKKDLQLISMEVSIKDLLKQYSKLKNDVKRKPTPPRRDESVRKTPAGSRGGSLPSIKCETAKPNRLSKVKLNLTPKASILRDNPDPQDLTVNMAEVRTARQSARHAPSKGYDIHSLTEVDTLPLKASQQVLLLPTPPPPR